MRVQGRLRSLLCVWLAAATATLGCGGPTVRAPVPPRPEAPRPVEPAAPSGRATVTIDTTATEGQLSVTTADTRSATTATAATPLSDAETRALLARLEPMPDLSRANASAPAVRPASAPPPRPGPAQAIAFVVPTGKAVGDAPISPGKARPRPLVPPQISPSGEIRSDSEIRVRFDEPMVAVAEVGTPATPPATITPSLAGTWRWIDTRVVVFTAAGPRLPQATEVVVTVPAGTRALSGNTLATAVTGTFATRPVTLVGTFPGSPRLDSPIVLKLDQDVDPARLAPFVRIEDARHRPLAWKAITLAEAQALWARDPSIAFDAARAGEQLGAHYLIAAPVSAWPPGIEAEVIVKAGAPSREGPRVSTDESAESVAIAPLFTLLGLRCDDMEKPRLHATCSARSWLDVELSNAIDLKSYRAGKVRIAGQPFEDTAPSGDTVGLYTPPGAGRSYTVEVAGDLTDVHGQALRGPLQASFQTSRERFEAYVTAQTGLYVLDPRFQIPQWVVHTEAVAQVRVQLYQVEPKDYFAFSRFEAGERPTPPGKRVVDSAYPVGARQGATVRVDLRPALAQSGTGHVIAVATATRGGPRLSESRRTAWIEVTRLGLVARADGEKLSAWVQDISPASFLAATPAAQASLLVEGRAGDAPSVAADAAGHLTLELPAAVEPRPRQTPEALLVARTATDSVFTSISGHAERAFRQRRALWYVTDDRFTYKPGEKVYVKGWVRWTHDGVNPGLALPSAAETIAYAVHDSARNKIASGTLELTPQGGFDVEVALPDNINLGMATFTFAAGEKDAETHRHPFAVQEFRTPAYAVDLNDDVTHAGATPLILGESVEMSASAHYYAGGGLPGAALEWDATLAATTYRPPGWDGYGFAPIRRRGQLTWRYEDWPEATSNQAGQLSGASAASVVYGVVALPGNRPSILSVDATVTDVDRATIRASSRPILVHPSAYYVGVRQRPGSTTVLELVVTDIDGRLVAGVPIDVEIEGVLGSEREREDAAVTDTQGCKLVSAAAPVPCQWKRGSLDTAYTVRARIADPRGRGNGVQYEIPWWSHDDDEELSLTADKKLYRPGEVARIEIRSKVFPATALVTFARNGVISQERVELKEASTFVTLPIDVTYLQNVRVLVDRLGPDPSPRKGGSPLPFPVRRSAETDLAVDVESARLVMTARAVEPLIEPGAEATFEVEVRHDDQAEAGAEVALLVVDEAVLALSSRSFVDPLPGFFRAVRSGTTLRESISMIHDAGPDVLGAPGFERYSLDEGGRYGAVGHGSGSGSMGMGVGGGGGGGSGTVTARKDFRANAVFSPRLLTDAAGKVRVTVKMPDSLTRFRIVALATSDTRNFGKAEGTIVTQRKVNARTVAPRFLTQGDRFSLPVVVQNLEQIPRTVEVAVRAGNLRGVGPAGKRVVVGGGQRAEVRFDFATEERGRAVIQTIVTSGAFADASNVELPVYEPATTESFATYGTVDDAPRFEELAVPAELFPDVGGVEVELASTQLQSLTDAYWYLYAYPYECAEQRSSRMIATAAMWDILEAFATGERPTKAEIDASRVRDARLLAKEQLEDGGWGYFHGMRSDPFVSLQVVQALGMQKIPASEPVLKRGIEYAQKLVATSLARLERSARLPVSERKDRAEHPYVVGLAAAALTALATTGADVRRPAERLHAAAVALGAYPMDARARVLAVLAGVEQARAIRTRLLGELVSATHETASSATVTTDFGDGERLLLVSSTKTSALALGAIMREAPEHALVTKLARGVLDGRRHGRWRSTQENQVALVALRGYFDRYEKATPDFDGKLWFGKVAYTEQGFHGRSGARGVARLDWTALAPGSTHELAIVKDGPGRMYYRVGITYAPRKSNLEPLDAGFIVRRGYAAVDDPADVTRDAEGRWHIRLGAKVQVTLEALNTTRRFNVALVDPLPAGLEVINENLATSERGTGHPDDERWDYQNMRDNRAEAFAVELGEGAHRLTYAARATTPGTFVAAPSKAEEMYTPETFGRSAGTTVVVE